MKDAIGATKEKLDSLKAAQEQAKQQLENGDLGQDKYDALQREIIETEQELRRLQEEAASTSAALSKINEAGKKIEAPKQLFSCYQHNPLTCHNAIRPVSESRRSDSIIAGIHETSEDDGNHHDEGNLLEAEIKLLRRLGNGIEADVSPGSYCECG